MPISLEQGQVLPIDHSERGSAHHVRRDPKSPVVRERPAHGLTDFYSKFGGRRQVLDHRMNRPEDLDNHILQASYVQGTALKRENAR